MKEWTTARSAWQYNVMLSMSRGGGLVHRLSKFQPEYTISATSKDEGKLSYHIAGELQQEHKAWAKQWQAALDKVLAISDKLRLTMRNLVPGS